MKKAFGWTATSLLALSACFLAAQEPGKAIVDTPFAEDAGGWSGIGPNAKLVVFHDAALGAPTKGALRFNYGVNKGEFNALLLQPSAGTLKDAQSVRFAVRADSDTAIAITLQESDDGGRYVAMVHAPKDKWQEVELSVADFALARDADDPKDPNGKLDLDLVSYVVMSDLNQFFTQVDSPGAADLFAIKPGPHTLYVDDFKITTKPVTPQTTSVGDDVRLDGFTQPQVSWLGFGGGISFTKSKGQPAGGNAMQANYTVTPGKPVLMLRQLAPWVLTQTKTLVVEAASKEPSKLFVQLEEVSGGKYNALIDLPGGSQTKEFRLPLADFKVADDSKDNNSKLDVGEVKSIAIIDATGLLEQKTHTNSLWISNLLGKS